MLPLAPDHGEELGAEFWKDRKKVGFPKSHVAGTDQNEVMPHHGAAGPRLQTGTGFHKP